MIAQRDVMWKMIAQYDVMWKMISQRDIFSINGHSMIL
jgi:hypothetical protein